jgi:hypothetical protein
MSNPTNQSLSIKVSIFQQMLVTMALFMQWKLTQEIVHSHPIITKVQQVLMLNPIAATTVCI